MELNINGARRTVRSAPDRPLLFVLRDELGLTGTKYGCGEGQCGACTVLLDGAPIRSCMYIAGAIHDRKITTIEALEQDGKLHPVQEAFIDTDALQCGYCTTGMIMGAVGLLNKNPNPEAAEVRTALQGNVCRCGTYPRIVEAVRMAARGNHA